MSATTTSILPRTQRAFVLPAPGIALQLVVSHPVRAPEELEPGQCLVKLQYSGVCHSDLTIMKGLGPPPKRDLVGGHEGVGTVVALGAHAGSLRLKEGDRVVCPNLKSHGLLVDGTFCEYTVAYVRHAIPIPEKLASTEAASIMCAGVTVYAALQQSGARIGETVVISGAGGGLGHLAIQYAVAMGLSVIALDTGSSKRELALSLGASAFVDFAAPEHGDVVSDVVSLTGGLGAHVALVCTGSTRAYADALKYVGVAGTLMVVGIPPGRSTLEVPFGAVIGKGLTIKGLITGSRQEAWEALAASGKVHCHYALLALLELEKGVSSVLKVHPTYSVHRVFEEMERGEIVGRVVLDISK